MKLDCDPETDSLYIDNASTRVQLKDLFLSKLPSKVQSIAA